jgi:hypothetical protein
MDHPEGATHYQKAYSTIGFYKMDVHSYGAESGEPFRCWHWWNGKKWMPEFGVRDHNFKRIECCHKTVLTRCKDCPHSKGEE